MREQQGASVAAVHEGSHDGVEGSERWHGFDSDDFEVQKDQVGEGERYSNHEEVTRGVLHEGRVGEKSRQEQDNGDEVEELALDDLRLVGEQTLPQTPAHRNDDGKPVEKEERTTPVQGRAVVVELEGGAVVVELEEP